MTFATIAAGQPLVQFIKICYASNTPPLLIGRHGVGKSEIMAEATDSLGIRFISRDLSLMEPPDLAGIPRIDDGFTHYASPAFLPVNGKGILLFEELNRAERYMRAPCLQLLTGRSLNDYRLPDGWLPAAAINPDEEGYEVHELDEALLSRFAKVIVVPDRGEWLAWAKSQVLHPDVIRYVETDPTVFDEPDSNPRAWSSVSDLLYATDDTPDEILHAGIVGLVGPNRANTFLQHLRRPDAPLTCRDVLESYHNHQDTVQTWILKGRLDRVEVTLLALKRHLQPEFVFNAVRSDETNWSNLARFLYDLPGDQLEDARRFFEERDYEFPNNPNSPKKRRRAR